MLVMVQPLNEESMGLAFMCRVKMQSNDLDGYIAY